MDTKKYTKSTSEFSAGENKRIRVLFVISDLSGGGAERAISTYLHHIDRNRFEPGLCLWRNVFAYDVPKDVPVWEMNKRKSWHAPRTVWRMARLINKWQPDVVISFLAYVNLLTGLAVNLSHSLAIWMPTVRSKPLNSNKQWSNSLWIRMRNAYQIVGVVSMGISDSMSKDFKVPSNKLITLYNPVDFYRIDNSIQNNLINKTQHYTIITMGRLVEAKDQATLLKAVQLVFKTHSVRLVIMGDGPLRGKLEMVAHELEIDNIVEFRGFIETPFPYIAAADLFVLSSRWEGFGNALAEAMGCGTAVVSTDCPYGPNEIIDNGKSGLLVPIGDPELLADAITRLLDDPVLRNRLAEKGRTRVRKLYDAQKCTQILEDALEYIVDK